MGMGLVLSRDRMWVQNSEPKRQVVENKIGWVCRGYNIQSFVGQSKGFNFYPRGKKEH